MRSESVAETLGAALATIRQLKAENAALSRRGRNEPVAIVGTGFRLPGGADTPERLWQVLTGSTDVVAPLPAHRWAHLAFDGFGAVGSGSHGHVGAIGDVSGFDGGFFGVSDHEAHLMDPQQRVVLETTWEAAERAGWALPGMQEERTGVFLGVAHQDYLFAALAAEPTLGAHLGAGVARSIVANRVSYLFGLTGPSLTVDTACSSSLMALHLACQSLWSGECDRAFAGGINLILSPVSTAVTGRALPFAPDGHCKALSADADGMVRSEGSGVVALRPLSAALADGDPVAAVIRASGTNQDGRTNGLTAPNPAAQARLLRGTLAQAELTPDDITSVEMHGTGTPLGDPIEVEGILSAYGTGTSLCWLGSAKATIGHLESAAGVAAVLKVVETLQRRRIPAQVNLGQLNPEIRLDGTRFRVPRDAQPWDSDGPRRAAVSSFGFGGSNVHVILEQAPEPVRGPARATVRPTAADGPGRPVILPVSARCPAALDALLGAYADAALDSTDEAAGLATAAAVRRSAHPVRAAAVTAHRTGSGLAEALRNPLRRPAPAGGSPSVLFVFPGQSGQWPNMGAQLYGADPVIRAELDAWDAAVAARTDMALLGTLFGADAARALSRTTVAQLAISALQSALVARLAGWGVRPDAVCGHSVGEVAAACAAGALDRDTAVEVLLARSDALEKHAAGGAMLAVAASSQDVQSLLGALNLPRTGISVRNGEQATVVSGPGGDIDIVERAARSWRTRRLEAGYAFHAPYLADAEEQVAAALSFVSAGPSRCPLYSTVTGSQLPGTHLTGEHWARNVSAPVEFAAALAAAITDGARTVVEIGPGATLTAHCHSALDRAGHAAGATGGGGVVTLLPRGGDEDLALHHGLARLWMTGVEVAWDQLCPELPRAQHITALPTYPWQRRHHGVLAEEPRQHDPDAGGDRTARAAAGGGHVPAPREGHTSEQVLRLLQEHVARVMGLADASAVAVDVPARDLDVDSMAFVEVKNAIEDVLGAAIPITALLDGGSLRQIASRMAPSVRGQAGGAALRAQPQAAAPGPGQGTDAGVQAADGRAELAPEDAQALLARIDELSEEELDALLLRLDGSASS